MRLHSGHDLELVRLGRQPVVLQQAARVAARRVQVPRELVVQAVVQQELGKKVMPDLVGPNGAPAPLPQLMQ